MCFYRGRYRICIFAQSTGSPHGVIRKNAYRVSFHELLRKGQVAHTVL